MTNDLALFVSGACFGALLFWVGLALCKAAGDNRCEQAIAEEKLKRGGRDFLI